jgi:hypothetical protein
MIQGLIRRAVSAFLKHILQSFDAESLFSPATKQEGLKFLPDAISQLGIPFSLSQSSIGCMSSHCDDANLIVFINFQQISITGSLNPEARITRRRSFSLAGWVLQRALATWELHVTCDDARLFLGDVCEFRFG